MDENFVKAEASLLNSLSHDGTAALKQKIADFRYAYLTTQPKLSDEKLSAILLGSNGPGLLELAGQTWSKDTETISTNVDQDGLTALASDTFEMLCRILDPAGSWCGYRPDSVTSFGPGIDLALSESNMKNFNSNAKIMASLMRNHVDICEKINLSRHMLEAENNNTLQASHSFEFVFSLRVISSAFTDLSGWHVLLKDEDFKTYSMWESHEKLDVYVGKGWKNLENESSKSIADDEDDGGSNEENGDDGPARKGKACVEMTSGDSDCSSDDDVDPQGDGIKCWNDVLKEEEKDESRARGNIDSDNQVIEDPMLEVDDKWEQRQNEFKDKMLAVRESYRFDKDNNPVPEEEWEAKCNQLALDHPSFDPKAYLREFKSKLSRHLLLQGKRDVEKNRGSHGDKLKRVVKDKFNEFVTTKDRVDNFTSILNRREFYVKEEDKRQTGEISRAWRDVLETANSVFSSILKQGHLLDDNIKKHSILVRYKATFELPTLLRRDMKEGEYESFLKNFKEFDKKRKSLDTVSAFNGVVQQVELVVSQCIQQMWLYLTEGLCQDSPRSLEDQLHIVDVLRQLQMTDVSRGYFHDIEGFTCPKAGEDCIFTYFLLVKRFVCTSMGAMLADMFEAKPVLGSIRADHEEIGLLKYLKNLSIFVENYIPDLWRLARKMIEADAGEFRLLGVFSSGRIQIVKVEDPDDLQKEEIVVAKLAIEPVQLYVNHIRSAFIERSEFHPTSKFRLLEIVREIHMTISRLLDLDLNGDRKHSLDSAVRKSLFTVLNDLVVYLVTPTGEVARMYLHEASSLHEKEKWEWDIIQCTSKMFSHEFASLLHVMKEEYLFLKSVLSGVEGAALSVEQLQVINPLIHNSVVEIIMGVLDSHHELMLKIEEESLVRFNKHRATVSMADRTDSRLNFNEVMPYQSQWLRTVCYRLLLILSNLDALQRRYLPDLSAFFKKYFGFVIRSNDLDNLLSILCTYVLEEFIKVKVKLTSAHIHSGILLSGKEWLAETKAPTEVRYYIFDCLQELLATVELTRKMRLRSYEPIIIQSVLVSIACEFLVSVKSLGAFFAPNNSPYRISVDGDYGALQLAMEFLFLKETLSEYDSRRCQYIFRRAFAILGACPRIQRVNSQERIAVALAVAQDRSRLQFEALHDLHR